MKLALVILSVCLALAGLGLFLYLKKYADVHKDDAVEKHMKKIMGIIRVITIIIVCEMLILLYIVLC